MAPEAKRRGVSPGSSSRGPTGEAQAAADAQEAKNFYMASLRESRATQRRQRAQAAAEAESEKDKVAQ